MFGAKRSNQWTQYSVDAVKPVDTVDAVHSMQWNSGIWWWGHCLWCKKVKPVDAVDTVCCGIVVYGDGDIVFGAKRSNQWMQWTQYAVRSGIVVYGGGDIVFGAKRSNQWMQYTVDAVCSMQWNSGIWWWGHCLWCKKIKPVDTVDAVRSGHSMQWTQYTVDTVRCGLVVYGGGDIVFGAKRSNQ